MNRKIFLSLSLFTSTLLFAEGVDTLDKVVVIGTKTENKIFDLPTQAILIDSDEIASSGANNLSELLENVSGLYISPSGTRMSLRGMAHADTMLLIDGKRVNGEYSKSYELQRIPTGMIERIEILKGSSSLLYGSDAMGGVINIITKKPKDGFGGNIQLTGGKGKKAADFFVRGGKDKTSFSIFANYQKLDAYSKSKKASIKIMQSKKATTPSQLKGQGNWAKLKNSLSDSYTVANDYRRNMETKNIGLSLTHKINDALEANLDVSYLLEEKDGDYIGGSYATAYKQNSKSIMAKNVPAEQIDDNTRFDISAGLNYIPTNNLDFKYQIAYSKYEKDRKIYTPLFSELGYSTKEESLSSPNESTLEYLNNELSLTYTLNDNNRVLAGAEHRINDVKSSAFNVNDRTYSSIFVQHEYQALEKLNLVYGGRYDKTSIGENETSFSFGGTYAILENTKLKANYSQGFRSPDSRELYVDQTNPAGKRMIGSTVIDADSGKTTAKELLSETSDTIEIGIASKGDNWMFDAAVFQTTIDDRISRISPQNKYFTFDNITDSEIKGFETTLAVSLIDNLLTKISYSKIDAENKTDNKKLSDTPENLASLSISYFPKEDIELKTIAKYTGKQTTSDDEKLDAFTILNVKAHMSDAIKNFDFFAGVDNIFSETTDEYLGLRPEAYYYVGVNYKF